MKNNEEEEPVFIKFIKYSKLEKRDEIDGFEFLLGEK